MTEEDSIGSDDEALLDMLGLNSLSSVGVVDEEENKRVNTMGFPNLDDITGLISQHRLNQTYQETSMCMFPPECSISAERMRQLTEALVWGGDQTPADRTHETIALVKGGQVHHQRKLTRLENFVDTHEGWNDLCRNYLAKLLSTALGTEMVLYKEKLNLKPPGGSGFAPHLDAPSLRIALGKDGPQSFCTVMVAIDDMNAANGCLRIAKGAWSEENSCDVTPPDEDGNPDAGGRAGAVPLDVAQELPFEDVVCRGGSIVAFNGWAPHRSAANRSLFSRRAVFLTYNPKSEGDFHSKYYQVMEEKRRSWRESVGLVDRQQRMQDEKFEMEALSTVPS